MKEIDFRKIISPFKDIFDNPVVTKTQVGIRDFVSGVKNLFLQNDEKPVNTNDDINNYLKTPDEIEAEIRFTSARQKDFTPLSDNFSGPEFLIKSAQPANIKTLEEAMAGEMEENY